MGELVNHPHITRKNQLWALIILSALSAASQYVIQGALAADADLDAFPQWFWVMDFIFWGIRALIEGAVIVYLFSTQGNDKIQRIILGFFEVALIALITLTVGPSLRALGMHQPLRESVPPAAYWLWTFGLAAYTSLMIGAAAYAYRVQPGETVTEDNPDLFRELGMARNEAQEAMTALQQTANAVDAWGLLNATDRAALVASLCDGDRPTTTALAEAMDVSPSTVTRGYKKADRQ